MSSLNADDLFIFLNGASSNLKRFCKFLLGYQTASGQMIHFDKSHIIPPSSISSRRLTIMKNTLQVSMTSLLVKYLGSYLHRGISRAQYCMPIIRHFEQYLQGWNYRILSQAGCLILIRHS